MKNRNTFQRQLVLDAVKQLGNHPTAEQVYAAIIKQHPQISKATVYRNLNQLTRSGELLNIGNFKGSSHYDHNCHGHYHFICNDCQKIYDINEDFSGIMKQLNQNQELNITGYSLSFNGLCKLCK